MVLSLEYIGTMIEMDLGGIFHRQLSRKTIWITGAGGFAGSYVCKKLSEIQNYVGCKVVAVVKGTETFSTLDYYARKGEIGKIDILKLDLTDYVMVEREIQKYMPDIIINFASQPIVSKAIAEPYATVSNNVMLTLNLLEATRKICPYTLFVHISTDKVYGNGEADETSTYFATDPYSASKVAADALVQSYSRTYDLETIIIRPCNLIGPGDYNRRVVPNVIREILEKDEATIYEGDEERYRSYLSLEDFFLLLLWAIDKIRERLWIVNFSLSNVFPEGNFHLSTYDLVMKIVEIAEAVGYSVKIKTSRPEEYKSREILSQKLSTIYADEIRNFYKQFEIVPTIEQRLEGIFDWYQRNIDFLKESYSK